MGTDNRPSNLAQTTARRAPGNACTRTNRFEADTYERMMEKPVQPASHLVWYTPRDDGARTEMLRRAVIVVLVWMGSSAWTGQAAVTVSPEQAAFRVVAGGYLGVPQKVQVSSEGGWKAEISGQAVWLRLDPASAQGSATLTISLVDWGTRSLSPGTYSAEVVITPDDAADAKKTIKVMLEAVPPLPSAQFTYLNGPHGCSQLAGHEQPAVCDVPDEKPPGNFTPPRRGGSYIDPNFGALVRVIADPPSLHAYSSPSPMNADNKYVLVRIGGNWSVVSPVTGEILHKNLPVNEPRGTMWDAYEPEVYYIFEKTAIRKHDLRTGSTTVLIDYSSGPRTFADIKTGGAAETSKDNWISFFAENEKQICAVDLTAVKTYCASYENVGRVTLNPSGFGAMMSKGVDSATGKRYVMLTAHPAMAFFSVNLIGERLDFEFLAPERVDQNGNLDGICDPGERCYKGDHSDTFEDANGIQYVIGALDVASPCSFGIYSFQINTGSDLLKPVELGGGAKRWIKLFNCGGVDNWTDLHIGCAKQAAYCVISTTYGRFRFQRNSDDATPIKRTAFLSEIMIVKDHGAEIRRLVQHRSVPFEGEEANSYWTTPRAAISNDGAYVIAESNFGEANKQRVVIIETGYGRTRIAAIVDAASFSSSFSPGGIASIFGVNLAGCNGSPNVLPLLESYCGTTVLFDDSPARFYYASTAQLNVFVPQSLPPSVEVRLQVSRGSDPLDTDTLIIPASSIRLAPAIFAYTLDDEVPRAVIQNVDGNGEYSLNGPPLPGFPGRPQFPGEAGVLYANGLGPTSPAVLDGDPAPAEPPAVTTASVELYVNNRRQSVFFAGLSPGSSGLYQVNYKLDPATDILEGDNNRIWLVVDGVQSPSLTISIARPG